jgi:initiation factor 1A
LPLRRCTRPLPSTLSISSPSPPRQATNTSQQGGKNRRRGKNENDNEKRELVFKEEGQEYAQVVKMLGNGRLEAQCFDGARRLAHIRGKLRKKVWINQGDIILLSLRDYQDEKGDVIMKYSGKSAPSQTFFKPSLFILCVCVCVCVLNVV